MLFASDTTSSVVDRSNTSYHHTLPIDVSLVKDYYSRLQQDVTNPLIRLNSEVSKPTLLGNRQPTHRLGSETRFREVGQYGQIHYKRAIVVLLHCVVLLEAHVTPVRGSRARL